MGLSGLTEAFLYAGSRALLVSHWRVNSEATVALITRLFKELADHPGIGRSEALRRAMLAVMNDSGRSLWKRRAWFAPPMFWAPFVVMGEGANASERHLVWTGKGKS